MYLTAFLDAKSGVMVGWNITENPELTFLHKVAQTAEGIRGAVRLFGNAYDAEAYDLDGLANMAKFMRIDLTGIGRLI